MLALALSDPVLWPRRTLGIDGSLTVAFVGIVIRRSVWLLAHTSALNSHAAQGINILTTYLVSLAFLAAMTEAILFHRAQRRTICTLSSNILQLERRLEEREHGRAGD